MPGPGTQDAPRSVETVDAAGHALDPEILRQIRAEMLSSLAHDLQQPLTVVKGHAQLLQRAVRGDLALTADGMTAGLAQIIAAADRMASQLRELLDLSGGQLGRSLVIARRPADLVALARAAVADQQRDAGGIPVALATTERTLVAYVDAARLRRVLDNLLGNAVKYSPGGRAVIASVEREEGPGCSYAVIRVRDQGIGIPAADLPHVTERFYRGTNVDGIFAGSGIGLAGALQIVQEHGGTLALESTEGLGTIATVRVPLVPTSTDEPAQDQEELPDERLVQPGGHPDGRSDRNGRANGR